MIPNYRRNVRSDNKSVFILLASNLQNLIERFNDVRRSDQILHELQTDGVGKYKK